MLETMTHITISRFHRDRGVFGCLQQEVLPALAAGVIKRGTKVLEVWIAGCASGEEAYTLTIMWELELTRRFPALALRILATDTDEAMLGRARRGCYQATSLRELPTRWHASAFSASDQEYCLREPFREPVTIVHHDVRTPPPAGPFDLVMCRNLAFTYFNLDLQRATVSRIDGALHCGGALVLGTHEALPENVEGFEPWKTTEPIYRHTTLPRAVADRGR